jgi:polyribonucleotide nucleotidyltransferase
MVYSYCINFQKQKMKPTPIIQTIHLTGEHGVADRTITIETGKLAKQADGAVVVRMGDTMILATVCASTDVKDGQDFFPLSVDYQEKFAGVGRIPGGFMKRESKLSDYEVLISRLVDRAIRPLFPDDYLADVQVNLWLISGDKNSLPDALAALAASAALMVSNIPFGGPISEVRVVKYEGKFYVNPAPNLILNADIDVVVAATLDNILMVEGECNEASEADMLEAFKVAHEAIKIQCQAQIEFAEKVAVAKPFITEKRAANHIARNEELAKELHDKYYQQFYDLAASKTADKDLRSANVKAVKKSYFESLPADTTVSKKMATMYLDGLYKKAARNLVLDEKVRLDGRKLDEIRDIWCEVDYLPSPHGSAIFTRGETQSLTTVTLGTKLDEQMIDGAMFNGHSRFILHYNFPGFSTGEVKPNRGPGRREVGHGNLAHRALKKMLPPHIDSPYTVRIVSDILESNGSSSMATVCAGTLALMDAGVKIKAPVSGIAMGLISDGKTGKYAILSDILGDEDHLGDMDFKVTGTAKGITACQMDIKIDGLSYELLENALEQARVGRLHILNKITETIAEPRADFKPHAPRAFVIHIPKELIGAVIGPGGKIIQEIQRNSGAVVSIEEITDRGVVSIFATSGEAMDKAKAAVQAIVAQPEVGGVYDGKVISIQPFGAFVEFMKGKEGLLHISEIKWERLETMDGVLEEGEEIQVKLVEVDKKTGKYRLSRKALLTPPEGFVVRERTERDSSSSNGNRDNNRRDNNGGGYKKR